MADDDSSSSQQKKPSELTMEEYVTFIDQNKKLNTLTERDNQMESLAAMAGDVWSDDRDKQLEATSLFRNILQINPNPPFQRVIQAGVVPRFVQFLDRNDFPSLQVESVFILGMFVETSEHVNIIVHHGAVPGLANLIPAPYHITRASVIFTLGRIVGKSPKLRELVLQSRGLELLLDQFKENNLDFMLPIAAEALYLLCRGNPPLNSNTSSQVLPVLLQLLHSSIEGVIANACWILHGLTCARIGNVESEIMFGVCSKLVEMLDHTSPTVILPALMTVSNIVDCDELVDQNEYLCGLVIQSVILPNRLHRLEVLLVGEYDDNIKMAACLTVRNITRKNWHRTQEVIKHGIITALTHLYKNSEDDIKKEVARAIISLTCYGTPEDIKSVSGACIEPMCDMLEDPQLAIHCLKGLEKILHIWQADLNNRISSNVLYYTKMIEDLKGLQKIVNLRNHGQGSVFSTAQSILHKYWPHVG